MAFLSLLLQAQVPVLFHGFIEGRIEQTEAGLVEVVIRETRIQKLLFVEALELIEYQIKLCRLSFGSGRLILRDLFRLRHGLDGFGGLQRP